MKKIINKEVGKAIRDLVKSAIIPLVVISVLDGADEGKNEKKE